MDDIDIGKIIVSNKVSCEKGYKYLVDYKDDNNLYHYVLDFHKWMRSQEILMKPNVFLFYQRRLNVRKM